MIAYFAILAAEHAEYSTGNSATSDAIRAFVSSLHRQYPRTITKRIVTSRKAGVKVNLTTCEVLEYSMNTSSERLERYKGLIQTLDVRHADAKLHLDTLRATIGFDTAIDDRDRYELSLRLALLAMRVRQQGASKLTPAHEEDDHC